MENLSLLDKFNLPFSELWKNHKIFFIVFGLLIVIVKFREVIIDILLSSARNILQDAKDQNATLKNEQDAANNQANQIVDNANKLDDNKPKVDEDWYKK